MCIKTSKPVSITSWNVNGLFKRVNNERVCKLKENGIDNFLQSDITCLMETHAKQNDVLQHDGYKCYMINRNYTCKKPSGGLAIFIKRNIVHGTQLVDKSNKDMVWFKLDKGFFRLKLDLYLCFVYISPKNSSYTKKTNCDKVIFEKLERDISKYSKIGDIVLMGDLNAHIDSEEKDYIVNDSDNILDDFLPQNYIVDTIHKNRNTELNQRTNEYGKSILELCSDAQLRILNGRTIGDSVGKITYHNYIGASIDDYCLCNTNFLQNIVSFKVHEFDPVLSDHCPIEVKIWSQSSKNCLSENLNMINKKIIWNELREKQFYSNVSTFNFETLCKDIDDLIHVNENSEYYRKSLNEKVSDFSEFLFNSAKNSRDGKYKKRGKKKNKKLWYDNECETKYRQVKSLARILIKNPWDKQLRQKVAY